MNDSVGLDYINHMSNTLIIISKVRSSIKLYTEGVSKQSIGEWTGLPRLGVKKCIRLFLASGKTPEKIDQLSDTELEQLFLQRASMHTLYFSFSTYPVLLRTFVYS
jgi:hypothetical protein